MKKGLVNTHHGGAIVENRLVLPPKAGDYTWVRYVKMRGSNKEIGKALADIAQKDLQLNLTKYADPSYGKQRKEYFQAHFPILDMHFLVADPSGNTFVCDRDAKGGKGLHFTYNHGKPQVMTNHPLYSGFDLKKLKPDPDYPQYFSPHRYNIIAKAIAAHKAKFSPDDMKQTLAVVDGRGFSYGTHGYRTPKPVPFRTSWAVLWDLNEKSMQVKFYLRDKEEKPAADGLPNIVYSDLYSFKLEGT